jgi:hypothetical protein
MKLLLMPWVIMMVMVVVMMMMMLMLLAPSACNGQNQHLFYRSSVDGMHLLI